MCACRSALFCEGFPQNTDAWVQVVITTLTLAFLLWEESHTFSIVSKIVRIADKQAHNVSLFMIWALAIVITVTYCTWLLLSELQRAMNEFLPIKGIALIIVNNRPIHHMSS